MHTQVGYFTAFSAGLLSFFSPCLLPLIPGYIMYITGAYSNEAIQEKRKKALLQTLGFVLGFSLVFMLLGISASALGQLFIRNQRLLSRLSGLVIILFGFMMTGLVNIPFLARDHRKKAPRSNATFLSAIGLGMAFAFGWTPCFGPILGAILAYTSALSNRVSEGMVLLGIYSLGMAIPFLITAYFIDFFERKVNAFGKFSKIMKPIAGGLMILIGLLIVFNKMYLITNFLFSI